ncbi:MAG TPA: hypothetical protein VG735_09725 [Caulobacterales bacterium]|jgi:hypothetical protein|nr:hypothetical protein [Caulobacterales bacterium]
MTAAKAKAALETRRKILMIIALQAQGAGGPFDRAARQIDGDL